MGSRKRQAEAIDISADEATPYSSSAPQSSSQGYVISQPTSSQSRPAKQARTLPGPSRAIAPGAGSSQAEPLLIDDEDDNDGSQEVADGTQGYNETEARYGLYGVLPTKIVGCVCLPVSRGH
jgi:SWI/SNF-related matrix-associated actin-dependent regulator of chromatin subfamily A3